MNIGILNILFGSCMGWVIHGLFMNKEYIRVLLAIISVIIYSILAVSYQQLLFKAV